MVLITYQLLLGMGEVKKMAHKKTTGPRAATAASKVLRDGRYSKPAKTAAASALSQTHGKGKRKK